MVLKFSNTARSAITDTFLTTIGSGGLLRIYSGTRPSTVGTALAGNTLLAEIALASPIGSASASGVLTLTTPVSDSAADNTGTASFFRIFKADGTTAVMDGDVGTSGADLNLNTTAIVSGGPVQITSFTLTAPGA